MKFRWSLAPPQPLLAGQVARALSIPPLVAQCLINRGHCETDNISRFLKPRLKNLSDPFLLPNMDSAVNRLFRAREAGEKLVIFGDYDVDGVTSTALLLEALKALGWNADYYLPHRMDEGYGLSQDAIENCLRKVPASLVLAVDCGSTARDQIAWLNEREIDVIVLDHHQVSNPAPAAAALVNPQLALGTSNGNGTPSHPAGESPGPNGAQFTELCSVGLAFKLVHALVKRGREAGMPAAAAYDVRPLLDLVALGTVADLVPLTDESRILVSAGLERLNSTLRAGLVALRQVSQARLPIGAYEVGFQLAPRLNAAGRLETAADALRLLMAPSLGEALPLAVGLDARNRERQRIEREIADDVLGRLQTTFKPETDFVIVEGKAPWHIGVVGIVASRVLQQYYRPTIIVGGDGGQWRGSGRSIPGFDLAEGLRACADLLTRHGGHSLAAGVSLPLENLDALRARLNQLSRKALQPEMLQAPLRLDAEVGLDEMTTPTLAALDQIRPFGQGNPPIQLMARNLNHARPLQRMGSDKRHVKMWVTDGAHEREAVWWGAGEGSLPVGKFDLAFCPQLNDYNGRRFVQLKVLDWRPA